MPSLHTVDDLIDFSESRMSESAESPTDVQPTHLGGTGAATVLQEHNTGIVKTVETLSHPSMDPFGSVYKNARGTPNIFPKGPIKSRQPAKLETLPAEAYLTGSQAPAQPTPRPKVSPLLRQQLGYHENDHRNDQRLLPSNTKQELIKPQVHNEVDKYAAIRKDYNERNMKKLDELLAAMKAIPDGTPDAVEKTVDPPHVAPHFSLSTPESYDTPMTSPPNMDEQETASRSGDREVRLTLGTYNPMLQDHGKLQAEVNPLKKTRPSAPKDDIVPEHATNLGIDMVPKSTLQRELQQKDQVIQDLQDLIGNNASYKQASRIKAIEANMVQLRLAQAAVNREEGIRVCKVNAEKDQKIANMMGHLKNLQKDIDAYMEKNADQRQKDLMNTLTLKEKQIDELRTELEVGRAQSNHLTQQLRESHARTDQSERILELEARSKNADTRASQTREENRLLKRQIEVKDKYFKNITGDYTLLRGAAHLVQPSKMAGLSKHVMGCFQCYLRNVDCDTRAECQNCQDNNEVCRRWRCSLQHTGKGPCPDYPGCKLRHDGDGWLIAMVERPQW